MGEFRDDNGPNFVHKVVQCVGPLHNPVRRLRFVFVQDFADVFVSLLLVQKDEEDD